ncbi:ImmA/IrrE family metallo-endopeptidase [Sneathiella sp. CAU 1612]|uniref:ImmA/IrrE family metallo-endopeptidase n=1 Tax=Sneathiella sedimenti TaxID=2816034 RepID=A0ABS3F534_9PROT|nr:ImmA/IrrE family metallo-endopeptidase [Sneathiella sedimenti]MBO0333598.1 ImmA/IrrE family metallo-endopeptidase [Sneathiella sedimenti]
MQLYGSRKIADRDLSIVGKYINEIPVRLGAMAKELGIQVKVSSLPSNYSGLIRKINTGYEIKINRYESRERQRFTLAHEIAHFLLHREIIDNTNDGIKDTVLYRSDQPQIIEFEANKLAADLVMPKFLVDQKMEIFNHRITEDEISTLAKDFGVSKVAMEIRLGQ